jgi:SAM-dependent methyltransferase
MATRTLDLGCGASPKNPFGMIEVFGVDLQENPNLQIRKADLAIEQIPFEDQFFDAVSAFDFIEHIPRLLYSPQRRYPFVELMNEIYRVLKPEGVLMSVTPAYPAGEAFRDPTHVNIITEETFPQYFDQNNRLAAIYGFNGYFRIVEQKWHENQTHLCTIMRKLTLK